LLAAVRDMGIEPVLYVETRQPVINVDLLMGFAADIGDGTVVRLNQEPDGSWGAPWQSWMPSTYTAHWNACRGILRSEAGIRVFWCPTMPNRAVRGGWWPGEADIVGFDRYAWDAEDEYPAQQWDNSVRVLQRLSPGTPIWVGEHGTKAGIPRRAERLREVPRVDGVEAVILMDTLAPRPDGKVDDWTWVGPMYRSWPALKV
jgi:hypothetical protein